MHTSAEKMPDAASPCRRILLVRWLTMLLSDAFIFTVFRRFDLRVTKPDPPNNAPETTLANLATFSHGQRQCRRPQGRRSRSN